jgi:hypothetical protein
MEYDTSVSRYVLESIGPLLDVHYYIGASKIRISVKKVARSLQLQQLQAGLDTGAAVLTGDLVHGKRIGHLARVQHKSGNGIFPGLYHYSHSFRRTIPTRKCRIQVFVSCHGTSTRTRHFER